MRPHLLVPLLLCAACAGSTPTSAPPVASVAPIAEAPAASAAPAAKPPEPRTHIALLTNLRQKGWIVFACLDRAKSAAVPAKECQGPLAGAEKVSLAGGKTARVTSTRWDAALEADGGKVLHLDLDTTDEVRPPIAIWPADAAKLEAAVSAPAPDAVVPRLAKLFGPKYKTVGPLAAEVALVADLDGDAKPDTLYHAWRLGDERHDGGASWRALFLQRGSTPDQLELVQKPETPGPGPGSFAIAATLDWDGDAKREVVAIGEWNHGFSVELAALKGGELKELGAIGYDE